MAGSSNAFAGVSPTGEILLHNTVEYRNDLLANLKR
jgi:hypothetical protein